MQRTSAYYPGIYWEPGRKRRRVLPQAQVVAAEVLDATKREEWPTDLSTFSSRDRLYL